MITTDGYLDWALRVAPGYAAQKVNGGTNTAAIYLPHSAVGYWPGFKGRIIDRPASDPTAKASVHGWIAYDGTVTQILPMTAQCWSSGSGYPNNNGIAFENEGGAPGHETEPLRPAQLAANARIIGDIGVWKGRSTAAWVRPDDPLDLGATLYEHRECIRFGSDPTACPSGRINWDSILWLLSSQSEGEGEMYIVSKAKTGAPDWYKSYLVRGREFKHIPDPATFEALAALQLQYLEPDAIAWAFLTDGCIVTE